MAGTRGFFGRAHKERDPRLPPGQYDVGSDWPVLTAEVTPRIAPERWSITVDGLVAKPTTWSWAEAHALPFADGFTPRAVLALGLLRLAQPGLVAPALGEDRPGHR